METLRINSERLNQTIQSTCDRWGAIPFSTGMSRLALSADDKGVRDWLVNECKALGCEVRVDEMGNIFAIRPGLQSGRSPIGMGSHLDTQPAGGRYDGTLGVIAALEVLRTLNDHGVKTNRPLALINWTNEEGARFGGAMMSSGVWSTKSLSSLQACHEIEDPDGVTLHQALREIGYLGDTPCDYRENNLACHFELHIEQGPILEQEKKTVGIVTAVQAMKWFRVRVSGIEGHAGTQSMETRSDALVTASRLITSVRDMALGTKLGVATVGVIHSDTHAQATIPAGVEFVIDVRCTTDSMVTELEEKILEGFNKIIQQENNKTAYQVLRTWGLPQSTFDTRCIEAVRAASVDEVGEDQTKIMISRAGHDSAWTSRVCPTSMIFVPSKDGISHNPNEYTSPEHCAIGAQVLLRTVLKYDEEVGKDTL